MFYMLPALLKTYNALNTKESLEMNLKYFILLIAILFLQSQYSHALDNPHLIQKENMIYLGAFKLPKGKLNATTQQYNSLAYGGAALTFNPARNSIFIVGHPYENHVVELSIPEIVNDSDMKNLKTATVLQPAIDITNGNIRNLKQDGSQHDSNALIGGLLLFGNKLIGTSYAYYDADHSAARSHFVASPDWNSVGTQFKGMYSVGTSGGGYVGGYMALIPQEWQSLLGGPALTGLGGVPIITRTSFGPSAWVFNPDDLGATDPAPAQVLVGYPSNHPTLGEWDGASLYFNNSTEVRGLVFPKGTQSLLFFGKHGLGQTGQGDSCYGTGTTDVSKHKTNGYCYDPADSTKGTHAYPYVYRVWAYDVNELVSVKNEIKNPWDVTPYAIWNLDFPFGVEDARIIGAAYDENTRRLFISQSNGEPGDPYDPFPLIHVYELSMPNKVGTNPTISNELDIDIPTATYTTPFGVFDLSVKLNFEGEDSETGSFLWSLKEVAYIGQKDLLYENIYDAEIKTNFNINIPRILNGTQYNIFNNPVELIYEGTDITSDKVLWSLESEID